MSLKKDKEKVLDEVWNEQRVKDFLLVEAAEDVNADFHVLLKAYQSMRLENFEEFIGFFTSEKRDLNATDNEGNTLLSIVRQHRRSGDYVKILENNGAA